MEKEMSWEPIETAPKDGGYMLLVTEGQRQSDAQEGFWRSPGKIGGEGKELSAGWVHSIDPDTPYPFEPTHWRNMPELPDAD